MRGREIKSTSDHEKHPSYNDYWNNRNRNVSDLKKYLSCDDYWNNGIPNILIYGNKSYGEYVIKKLLDSLPLFVMEVTADEVRKHPGEVTSKLSALYEAEFNNHHPEVH